MTSYEFLLVLVIVLTLFLTFALSVVTAALSNKRGQDAIRLLFQGVIKSLIELLSKIGTTH